MQVSQGTPGRRVAVVGIGVVAPCGIGAEAFFSGLTKEPAPGPRRIEGFDPTPFLGAKEIRRSDRFTQMALVACIEAIKGAGLQPEQELGPQLGTAPERLGVLVATGVGGILTLEEQIVLRHERGDKKVSPLLVPMMMANAAAAAASMRWQMHGPCETVATACASGAHAVANAARWIARGECDFVLAGGSEAPLTPTAMAAFSNMGALSSSGISRPFDANRDGFVIAEGAAILALEEAEHARQRGATLLAEIAGAGSTADAYHITAPEPSGRGAIAAMLKAIEDAGLSPSDIAHINAHGTSTPLNDLNEAIAINAVFGKPGPPVTSIKGVTGHTLGAAGAMEAAASVLSITKGVIPPTIGFKEPGEGIELDVVAPSPRQWQPGPILSNSFGFGGHNCSLVIKPI
jgi:3-oxoacyl-[acyl-carrier-protein] synthase II